MGNSASDINETSSFIEKQITELEETLSSIQTISASYHQQYQWFDKDTDIILYGNKISCNSDVSILFGPVIGKVTDTTVRILLEMDTNTNITCHLSIINKKNPYGIEYKKQSIHFLKKKPQIIEFTELHPNTMYIVIFGGIKIDDVKGRIGKFKTLNHDPLAKTNIVFCSGDKPSDLMYNDTNLWEDLNSRFYMKESFSQNQEIDLIIHLGGQIDLEDTFNEAWDILYSYAKDPDSSSISYEGWDKIEKEIEELFREAYRLQWNIPAKRKILASTSNIMLLSDQDIFKFYTIRKEFHFSDKINSIEIHIKSLILRTATKIFNEYQRSLLGTEVSNFNQELEIVSNKYIESNESIDNSISSTSVIDLKTKLNEVNREIELIHHEISKIKDKNDIVLLNKMEDVLNTKLYIERDQLKTNIERYDTPPEICHQESFYKIRNIGIMLLDIRTNRLHSDGSQLHENSLLNDMQWEYMASCLKTSKENELPTEYLIVCCENPIVFDKRDNFEEENIFDSEIIDNFFSSSFSGHEKDQIKLLNMFIDWQLTLPDRKLLLVTGHGLLGYGYDMIIKDLSMKISIPQIVVGPITSNNNLFNNKKKYLFPTNKKFFIGNNQFEIDQTNIIKFEKLQEYRHYIKLTFHISDTSSPLIQKYPSIHLLGSVTVGPIVGLVTFTSANILLEINQTSIITCVVKNIFTKEVYYQNVRLIANEPGIFSFNQLNPSQNYTYYFKGINENSKYRGHFHTLSPINNNIEDYILEIIFIPLKDELNIEKINNKKDHTIDEKFDDITTKIVSNPFSKNQIFIHILPLHHDKGFKNILSCLTNITINERNRMEVKNKIKENIRHIYRNQWKNILFRESWMNGSHLMIWNNQEVLSFMKEKKIPYEIEYLIMECYHEIYIEYEGKLWYNHINDQEYCYYFCDIFGIFVFSLPDLVRRETFMKSQLKEFKRLIGNDTIQLLFIVIPLSILERLKTAEPALNDNIFQACEKEYYTKLMELVFYWKRDRKDRKVIFLSGTKSNGYSAIIHNPREKDEIIEFGIPTNEDANVSLNKLLEVNPYTYAGHNIMCRILQDKSIMQLKVQIKKEKEAILKDIFKDSLDSSMIKDLTGDIDTENIQTSTIIESNEEKEPIVVENSNEINDKAVNEVDLVKEMEDPIDNPILIVMKYIGLINDIDNNRNKNDTFHKITEYIDINHWKLEKDVPLWILKLKEHPLNYSETSDLIISKEKLKLFLYNTVDEVEKIFVILSHNIIHSSKVQVIAKLIEKQIFQYYEKHSTELEDIVPIPSLYIIHLQIEERILLSSTKESFIWNVSDFTLFWNKCFEQSLLICFLVS